MRGFSLIEMLIVVAIIGILAAIVIPALVVSDPPLVAKRVAKHELVFSTYRATSTQVTADDGSVCRYNGTDVVAGSLLECRWKTAEAAR